MSRSVKMDYQTIINRQRRSLVLDFIKASSDEVTARNTFKQDQTPENLKAWVDAKAALEDRKMKL